MATRKRTTRKPRKKKDPDTVKFEISWKSGKAISFKSGMIAPVAHSDWDYVILLTGAEMDEMEFEE